MRSKLRGVLFFGVLLAAVLAVSFRPPTALAQVTPPPQEPTYELLWSPEQEHGPRVEAGAETFTDPASGVVFPKELTLTHEGRTVQLKATGSGLRKRLLFEAYAAALYVDATARLDSIPLGHLVNDDLTRRIVLTFLRGMEGGKISSVFQEGFRKIWKTPLSPAVSEQLEAFSHYFDGGIRKGQVIDFTYVVGEGLYTVVAGQPKPLIGNPEIAHGIWAIWLGPDPISTDLRRDLVRLVGGGGPK